MRRLPVAADSQRILGHSRVQQTLAYAELLEGDIIAAADFARRRCPR